MKILLFLKNWSLPLAMIIGIVMYPLTSKLAIFTPYLIFGMLFLSYCRLSPRMFRINKLHCYLFSFQITSSLLVFFLIQGIHPVVAEGTFICILAPTATAATVITSMLGGDIAFITSYQIFSNVGISLIAPILFSFIGSHQDFPFIESSLSIASEVIPLLLFPLLSSWAIQYFLPQIHTKILYLKNIPFYLWIIAMMAAIGKTMDFFVHEENSNYAIESSICALSLLVCILQFIIGKKAGKHYMNESIAPGQSLGQKNTVLAIWMSHIYLSPIASFGPAFYIIWQNIINSWQLWKKRTNEIK